MKLLGKLDKTIFGVSVTVYLLIFLFIAIFPSVAESVITTVQNFTMTSVGWVYIVAYAFFLLALVYIAFSKYGKLKLGKADDKPEYSMFSWIGMLMGAGIGVGYVFYAVNVRLLIYELSLCRRRYRCGGLGCDAYYHGPLGLSPLGHVCHDRSLHRVFCLS